MKNILLTIILCVITFNLAESRIIFGTGSNGDDAGRAVTSDFLNNIIVAGNFSNSANFDMKGGNHSLSSHGGADGFIAFYDNDGVYQWAVAIGGTQDDYIYSVTTDYLGDVIVCGSFEGRAYFSSTKYVQSRGGKDIFIAKYSSTGQLLWVNTFGSAQNDEALDVKVDFMGYPYLAGYYSGSVNFDPNNANQNAIVTSNGASDGFVACFSDSGTFQWVLSFGGSGNDACQAVTPTGDGGFAVGGYFSGTCNFGTATTISLTSAGDYDIFLGKYDYFQTPQWVYRFGDKDRDVLSNGAIQTDDESNVIFGGAFNGKIKIDTVNGIYLNGKSGYDGFIAKFDYQGNYRWSVALAGSGEDFVNAISVDTLRNVYVTGSFTSGANFNPATGQNYQMNIFGPSGNANGFIAKYTQDGKFVWADNYGNSSSNIYSAFDNSIIVFSDGTSAVTGNFFDKSNFNFQNSKDSLTSAGQGDIFITKLKNNGSFYGDAAPPLSKITVTSPKTGDKWLVGSQQSIIWTSQNVSSVNIFYQTAKTTGWKSIASGVPAVPGSYSWTVPASSSSECFIRVVSSDDNNVSDTSGQFTIYLQPVLKLTSPVGGETFTIGTKHNIQWTYTGTDLFLLGIYYRTNDTSPWLLINNTIDVQSGSYNWTVPDAASTKCKIKIEDLATSGNNYSDVSTGYFTITDVKSVNDNSSDNIDIAYNTIASDNLTLSLKTQANGKMNLSFIDERGSLLKTINLQTTGEGKYTYCFDISDLAPGVYFVLITASDYSAIRKFIVLR